MTSSLMEIYLRVCETIRICAGNIRPYLEIGSSRVIVAEELYAAIQREQFAEDMSEWAKVRSFLVDTEPYPWLSVQLCLAILNPLVSLNTHFHKGKYKLSLRMLLNVYLAGDVGAFKSADADRVAQLKKAKAEKEAMEVAAEELDQLEIKVGVVVRTK